MSTRVRGIPPGRAGRVWLRRRLATARRGGDLLEQKLRILLAEEQSFSLRSEQTLTAWQEATRDLEVWSLRATLISGDRGLRLAHDGDRAAIDVAWRLTMGVRYPIGASCRIPSPSPADPVPDNSALIRARDAAAAAVRTGADHAVAIRALTAVRAEIVTTRRQVRALQHRWIPRLESAQSDLAVALEDQEHDEGVRLRWAAARPEARPR